MCCENMKGFIEDVEGYKLTPNIVAEYKDNIFRIDDIKRKDNYLFIMFDYCPFCGKELL